MRLFVVIRICNSSASAGLTASMLNLRAMLARGVQTYKSVLTPAETPPALNPSAPASAGAKDVSDALTSTP